MLNLLGRPYSLKNHFVMEPLFRLTDIPWRSIYKCGRQIAKSTSVAAQGVIQSMITPRFKTLYVLPLAEMTRRFSNNYVRPFITESPLKTMMIDPSCSQAVLQKDFINKAIMFFSYALLNCDRVRGIACDKIGYDEVQDLEWDFIPIIRECMSASEFGQEQYTGTPKTFDNTIEMVWQESSMAEWVIKCRHCNHFNIPSQDHHIHDMIGPVRNIALYGTALICAKCGRPLHSPDGRWVHRIPERRPMFAGYHVPQIVMPLHYSSEKKWTELLQKRDKMAPALYLNEVLGESSDVGTKLLTLHELQAAARLHKNEYDVARRMNFTGKYLQTILGVDWGGGGLNEVSFTTLAVLGLLPTGKLELVYGERLHAAVSDVEEVRRILQLYAVFQCQFVAHDFCGSGSVHETLLIQAGLPVNKILPFAYVFAPTKNIVSYHSPETDGSRSYYSLDKARALAILCALVKTQHLTLTEWESSKDLLQDFLHLIEDKVERPGKGDVFRIVKQAGTADDFVHACNYAAWGHFRTTDKYPKVASNFKLRAEGLGTVPPPPPGEPPISDALGEDMVNFDM